MQEARALVERGLRMFGIPFTPELKRWNPGAERWQDPALPVEPSSGSLGADWLELGELAWEVRLRLESRKQTTTLTKSLRDEGRAVITDGWRRVTVGVADQRAAESLPTTSAFAAALSRQSKCGRCRGGAAGSSANGCSVATATEEAGTSAAATAVAATAAVVSRRVRSGTPPHPGGLWANPDTLVTSAAGREDGSREQ